MKRISRWISQSHPVGLLCLASALVLAGLLVFPEGGPARAIVGRSGWLLVIGLAETGLRLFRRPASPPRLSRGLGCLVLYFSLVSGEALSGSAPAPWLGQLTSVALGLSPGALWPELALAAFGIGVGLPLWGGRKWPDLLECWGEQIENGGLWAWRRLRRTPDMAQSRPRQEPGGASDPKPVETGAVPATMPAPEFPAPMPSARMIAGGRPGGPASRTRTRPAVPVDELELIDLDSIKADLAKRYRRKATAPAPEFKAPRAPSVMMDAEEIRRRVLEIHGGQLPGAGRRRPGQPAPDGGNAGYAPAAESGHGSPVTRGTLWQSPTLAAVPGPGVAQSLTPGVAPSPSASPARGTLTGSLYGLGLNRPRDVNPVMPDPLDQAEIPVPAKSVNPSSGPTSIEEPVLMPAIPAELPAYAPPPPVPPPETPMPVVEAVRGAPVSFSPVIMETIGAKPPSLPPSQANAPAAVPDPVRPAPILPEPHWPRHAPEAYAPSLDLLQPARSTQEPIKQEELDRQGRLIQERLAEFKVNVTVEDACAGPVITRYEVSPAVGVRGAQVVNLMKDLARALGVSSIRVVETIPGKTCMGLELPNPRRQMICLSEVLSSEVFKSHASKLAMALGKDITGNPVVIDLARAPHLLVAGTTGSGKSVGVNAMILSLLYRAAPDEVRFIMIDPKMLELSVYDGIPHLLAPVVTDMKLAANALNWCVGEMERRYRLMSALGVRNLAGFNQKVAHARQTGRPLADPFSITPDSPAPLTHLPFIVVVVDEFADLMMVAGKKIEELIARLAQKARAAGIHLILATQRPSVDVITGLIKANIPTRIAFQVSSKIDSRTILDQMGAEALLGQGDMLYLPPGTGYPQRVHGAFVADEEVHALAEHLKLYGEPDYVEAVLGGTAEGEGEAGDAEASTEEADPLYDEAVAIVIKTRRASISLVQRQLRIGYNRAARLVEQMEVSGVVSAMESNGNRTVLVPAS